MIAFSIPRWFAKRFLHPDIVAEYSYIFLWDEDLGVENFNPQRYLVAKLNTLSAFQVSNYCNAQTLYFCSVTFLGMYPLFKGKGLKYHSRHLIFPSQRCIIKSLHVSEDQQCTGLL